MRIVFTLMIVALSTVSFAAAEDSWQGWTGAAPRDDLRPAFSVDAQGGPAGHPALVIATSQHPGLDGCWRKSFPVAGGKWYELACLRRLDNVPVPRRSASVRITWLDPQGKRVMRDEPIASGYRAGTVSRAEPEYAHERGQPKGGWTPIAGVFHAPKAAAQAIVELQLCWAPQAKAEYADITLGETSPPEGRKVRLAAVHLRPTAGKTAAEKCRQFEPLIAEAARQHADLVVLPETLTQFGSGATYAERAEPMPGPSSEYFGQLAKQHNLYIVAGLIERAGPLVYNVAVLLGPDGKIAGKYRKVTLPRGEHDEGVYPGDDYPVFETRFGKLGMMVCYDGFFPEVARELSNRGAEVIAWPVAGCNPLLARARACENHVFVVSSTYTDIDTKWMQTAVYDPYGEALAVAKDFNSIVVAEVDLDRPTIWNSMGDFKSEMMINRPLSASEAARQAQSAKQAAVK